MLDDTIYRLITHPIKNFFIPGSKDLQQSGDGCEYARGFRSYFAWSVIGHWSDYFD